MCLKLLQTAQPHGSLTVVGKVVTAAWASIRHQAGRFKLRVCRWRVCVFSIYIIFIWQLFRLQCPSHFLGLLLSCSSCLSCFLIPLLRVPFSLKARSYPRSSSLGSFFLFSHFKTWHQAFTPSSFSFLHHVGSRSWLFVIWVYIHSVTDYKQRLTQIWFLFSLDSRLITFILLRLTITVF